MDKVEKAQTLYDSNKYEEALELYNQLRDEAPVDMIIIQGIAKCLFRLNRFTEAIDISLKSLEINKNLPESHIILADAYDAINDIEKSRNEARIAFSLDPNSSDALGCYGSYLIKDNKVDDGISLLEKAELLNNNLKFIHRNLATAYYKKNNKKRMISELKMLYKLSPTPRLRFEILIAYMNKIKFVNIITGIFFITVIGSLISKIWNLLWITAFCFLILITLGFVIRKLWPNQK